jgi:hypothetical protein
VDEGDAVGGCGDEVGEWRISVDQDALKVKMGLVPRVALRVEVVFDVERQCRHEPIYTCCRVLLHPVVELKDLRIANSRQLAHNRLH